MRAGAVSARCAAPVRLAVPLLGLGPALLGGCTCGARGSPRSYEDASTRARVVSEGGAASVMALFSAPIGAARVGRLDIVAGLVAGARVVRAMGLADGIIVWTTDALTDVAWAPDAELDVQAAADGIALVWRGLHSGKPARTLMLLGPHGEPLGHPAEIGASFCATADGLAWIGSHATGPTHVRTRRWTEPDAHDVVLLPSERDPALICGDHAVVVLGDGDDDLTATTFEPGDTTAQPTTIASRDADFTDEEREHNAYTVGDDLTLVRVGASGAIATRELPRGDPPGLWRRLKYVLSADDEVVAVDGNADAMLLVVTREGDDTCKGAGSPERIRALRVDRKTGEESILELAPAECEKSPGPFWIGVRPTGLVVSWVERRPALPPRALRIAGIAFRVVRADGARAGQIDQASDAVANGGCDEGGCSIAALVREPENDGSLPASIRVLHYP